MSGGVGVPDDPTTHTDNREHSHTRGESKAPSMAAHAISSRQTNRNAHSHRETQTGTIHTEPMAVTKTHNQNIHTFSGQDRITWEKRATKTIVDGNSFPLEGSQVVGCRQQNMSAKYTVRV